MVDEQIFDVGGEQLHVARKGEGPPLLVLHDELGFAGWTSWYDAMAARYDVIVPLQPGYGCSPSIDWIMDYTQLGCFYARFVREQALAPVHVLGFSAGAYIAAEMAAYSQELLQTLTLVAPMGVRPDEGEISDFLAMTAGAQLAASVHRHDAPDVAALFGESAMTSEQFLLLEAARAETARLGWEPFMFNPALPKLLEGCSTLPALVVWGADDAIVPRGCAEVLHRALGASRLVVLEDVGHRPELEAPEQLSNAVFDFLTSDVEVWQERKIAS